MEARFDSMKTRSYAESPSLRVERSGLLRSLHFDGHGDSLGAFFVAATPVP